MIAFALLALTILALAVISCLPDNEALYTSLPMVILWGALAVTATYYIFKRRLYRRVRLFGLHAAFLVILVGAAVTHFSGTSQSMHLRVGERRNIGDIEVSLTDFRIDYYPGTTAPRDFISTVLIDGKEHTVAMNRIAKVDGYRFFQTSYDPDLNGSTLTVVHDPAGIAITYIGYAALLIFICLNLLPGRRKAAALLGLLLLPALSEASTRPATVPADIAEQLGRLYVYHNGRIAPVATLADDFTRHLTGSPSYRGLSAEQVLAGWLLYYDSWKNEPCIAIKDRATRRELGGKKYLALTDYFDNNGYRFSDDRHAEANEKFAVASEAAAGSLWNIFPYNASDSSIVWLSPVDDMPPEMAVDDWHITRHSLNYLAKLVDEANWTEAEKVITKIAEYQRQHAGPYLPSPMRTACENIYRSLAPSPWIPAIILATGILLLMFVHRREAIIIAVAALIWTGSLIALNWIASGHAPMSNGEETMQWMAFCSIAVTLSLYRRNRCIVPLGLIVAGLALFVSIMGQRTPQITQLMPVLNSPLLSLHVLTVMLAYSLLAIMALSGILWFCGRAEMLSTARDMLRPGVFLLTVGIFIGAVWANISWGRYWGWDPKEVWALITMLIYCIPLHDRTFKAFRSDKAYAIFCIAAFACVLMTYFGVNFVLGGLHSYS